MLNDLDNAMVAKPAPVVNLLIGAVPRLLDLIINHAIGRKRIDLSRINAPALKLIGPQTGLVKAIRAFRQQNRVLRDAEVLRRNGHHPRPPLLLGTDAEINRHFGVSHVPKVRLQINPVAVLLHRRCELIEALALELFLRLFVFLAKNLEHAGLDRERVLNRAIQVQKAGVFLKEDVLDVIRLLLRRFNVLWPNRSERRNVLTRENLDEVRKRHLNSV